MQFSYMQLALDQQNFRGLRVQHGGAGPSEVIQRKKNNSGHDMNPLVISVKSGCVLNRFCYEIALIQNCEREPQF